MKLLYFLLLSAALRPDWNPAWSAPSHEYSDWTSPAPPRRGEAWEILALKNTPPPRLTAPAALLGEDLLWLWQHTLSGKDGSRCPYYPSCSRYSRIAVGHYGLVLGVAMTADRLSRCHGHVNEAGHLEMKAIRSEWLIWNPPMDDAWWAK